VPTTTGTTGDTRAAGTTATSTPKPKITTIAQLRDYLYHGLRIEHATLPPYLMALYSLHPESNSDARHILRVVAVEEMLHLTLVANVLNAVRGEPDLTKPGFVPRFPVVLPDGEDDFLVHLRPFGREAVDTFLQIERPGQAPAEKHRIVAQRARPAAAASPSGPGSQVAGEVLAAVPGEPGLKFYSIGEFYEEINRGLNYLEDQARERGETIFTGDPARQATPEYYYSGGGEIIPVTSRDTAVRALTLIAEQGEGLGGGIYDAEDELAHYYRFEQLKLQRYYQQGDKPGTPTGPPLTVDWQAAYPVKEDPRLRDYPKDSELRAAATEFNEQYAGFLATLTKAYNGQPGLLLEAVWEMFRIRDTMTRLIRNPIPGRPGLNAGPTFEPCGVTQPEAS
jgi:Ferritin-like